MQKSKDQLTKYKQNTMSETMKIKLKHKFDLEKAKIEYKSTINKLE